MKAFQPMRLLLRASLSFVVAAPVAVHATTVWAQANCTPPCAAGQTCVQGGCMVPAPPPIYAPPPAYTPPPPPTGYQQTPTAPPYQGYPPAAGQPYAPPPQGNYYAAPPPQGGGYPPPPPGSYPPPPSAEMGQRRGVLFLPFVGFHTFRGDTGQTLGPGLRLGTLIGGHISENMSLNGELTIDALNVDNLMGYTDTRGADVVLAFSPLAHIPAGNIDIVIGPKLGFRAAVFNFSSEFGDASSTLTGLVLGLNAGAFAPVSNSVSIGGLVSAEVRTVNETCFTPVGGDEICSTDSADTGDASKVIALSAAALF